MFGIHCLLTFSLCISFLRYFVCPFSYLHSIFIDRLRLSFFLFPLISLLRTHSLSQTCFHQILDFPRSFTNLSFLTTLNSIPIFFSFSYLSFFVTTFHSNFLCGNRSRDHECEVLSILNTISYHL